MFCDGYTGGLLPCNDGYKRLESVTSVSIGGYYVHNWLKEPISRLYTAMGALYMRNCLWQKGTIHCV